MTLKERIALWLAKREVRKRVRAWLESRLGRTLTRREKHMLAGIFTNWKTTVLGLIGAIVQAAAGGMSWKAILMSLPTLLLGALAKDNDVTGGTVKQ